MDAHARFLALKVQNGFTIVYFSKLRMYWWTPDDSFLHIAPELFILPPQNKFAYSQGDVTTSSERIEVTKVISSDLEFMAPDFVRLLRNSQPRG